MRLSTGWNSAILQQVQVRSLVRAAPALNALLVVLLAYSLAQLTWRVWPAPEQPEAPPRAVLPSAAQVQQPVGMQIADRHLFGVFQSDQAADTGPPPETPLNLTLRGVFATEGQQNAYAIIADAQGKEEGYPLEAQLPGGAVLKEIHPDRVILTRGGRSEALNLPREALLSGPVAAASQGLIQAAPLPAPPPAPQPAPAQGAPAAGPDNSSVLRNYRAALKANPQSMAGLFPLEPVEAGGKLAGYRLLGGGDPALLGRFGLAAGDVVTAVNGVTLDSPAKASDALQNLSGARDLSLLVVRNGEQKSFSYHAGE